MNTLNIDQTDVDNASPLKHVLSKFYKWINRIRNEYDLVMPSRVRSRDENAYFCTWSSMDLNFFLPNECSPANKDISYANYLKYWIDGQETYYVRIIFLSLEPLLLYKCIYNYYSFKHF